MIQGYSPFRPADCRHNVVKTESRFWRLASEFVSEVNKARLTVPDQIKIKSNQMYLYSPSYISWYLNVYIFMFEAWNVAKGRGGRILSQGTVTNLHKCSHGFAMILQIELRYVQFHLFILGMSIQLDWSPPVPNSIVWTWFRKKHTCLYNVTQLTETIPWSLRNCL
jgi:hypothetical protein